MAPPPVPPSQRASLDDHVTHALQTHFNLAHQMIFKTPTKRDSSEQRRALVSTLQCILRHWIGRELATYPRGLDRFKDLLRRQFGRLLEDTLELVTPGAMVGVARHVEVTVEDVDVPKQRGKLDRLEFVFGLGDGYKTRMVPCSAAGSVAPQFLFLGKDDEDTILEIEVWKRGKNGSRCLGSARLPVADLAAQPVAVHRVVSGSAKAGHLTVRAQVNNREGPCATARVGEIVTDALQEELTGHFALDSFPRAEEGDEYCRYRLGLEIRQDVSVQESREEFVVMLNGTELTDLSSICWIDDIANDEITLAKKKCSSSSPRNSKAPSKEVSPANSSHASLQSLDEEVKVSKKGDNLFGAMLKVATPSASPKKSNHVTDNQDRKASLGENLARVALPTRQDGQKWKAIFTHTVNVADIPIAGEYAVSTDGVQWLLSWRQFEQDEQGKESSRMDPDLLLTSLFQRQLDQLPAFRIMQWDGRLDAKSREIRDVAWTLCRPEQWRRAEPVTLLKLHSTYQFSSGIVKRCLDSLIEQGADLADLKPVKDYLGFCAKVLAHVEPGHFGDDVRELQNIVQCMEMLREEDFYEQEFLRKFKMYLTSRLRKHFRTVDLQEMRRNSVTYGVSILAKISANFGPFGRTWCSLLADSILQISLAMVESVLCIDEKCDGTYELFSSLREIAKHAPGHRPSLHKIFEPCLTSWIETVDTKAREQTQKVLEFERQRHFEASWEDLLGVDVQENSDWLEGARDINHIFTSCLNTWKSLAWPKPKRQIETGILLVDKLQSVFNYYISELFRIVYEDGELDKQELAIVLNSLVHSVSHLSSICDEVTQYLEQSSAKPPGFISSESSGRLAAHYADQLVQIYCKGERAHFDHYVLGGNLFNENSDHDCLLGYANGLLEFFDTHLDMSSPAETEKYNRLIRSSLFKILEEVFIDYHKKLSATYKAKANPEIFGNFNTALDELILFRRSIRFPDHPRLQEISWHLHRQASSSFDLMSRHLAAVHRKIQENPGDQTDGAGSGSDSDTEAGEAPGEVTFHAGLVSHEDHFEILVDLKSLSKVQGRKAADPGDCNPSLSVDLAPHATGQLRDHTAIYERSKNVLMDFAPGRHRFAFKLARQDLRTPLDRTFLVLELFDHSKFKVHKVFRGVVLTPLAELARISGETELGSNRCRLERAFARMPREETADLRELRQRTDSAANSYVHRFERSVNRSRIPMLTVSQKWVKVSDVD